MTPPKKPEWIQIVDTDNATSVRKVSKALPVIALGSALMIIGAGVVFAKSSNEAPASAVETVVASVDPASQNLTTPTPSRQAQNVTAQNNLISVASKASAVAPKAPGIQNPIGHDGDNENNLDRVNVAPRSHDGGFARPHGGEHEDHEYEYGEDD